MCLQTNILGSSSYERRETADFGFAFILWQTAIEKLMASILSAIHCIYEYRRITSSHQLLQFDGVRTLDFFTSQSGQLSLKITSQISKLLAFGQFSTFLAIPARHHYLFAKPCLGISLITKVGLAFSSVFMVVIPLYILRS